MAAPALQHWEKSDGENESDGDTVTEIERDGDEERCSEKESE